MNLRIAAAIVPLFLLVSRPAAATELIVCNEGTIPVYAAIAADENEFFISHAWRVSGWYEFRKGACSRIYDSYEPFYFAFSFKDSRGNWGAARFTPDRDDMYQTAAEDLCVARGEFEYKRGGSDPVGPCKDGYFRFPGTLVFYPDDDYATFTLNVELDEKSRAYPVDLQPLEAVDPGAPESDATTSDEEPEPGHEPTFLERLLGAIIDAASEGVERGIEDAVEHGLTNPAPVPVPAPTPAPAAPTASPEATEPAPEQTLNARLFGAEVTRRSYGGAPWLNADRSSVEVFYELDGKSSSDLFDAPTQRAADDAEVSAALASLNHALASIADNREARITTEGRLKYDFEMQGGSLSRHWVNVEALDFGHARTIDDRVGYTGFAIPCVNGGMCVIAVDQDEAGRQ